MSKRNDRREAARQSRKLAFEQRRQQPAQAAAVAQIDVAQTVVAPEIAAPTLSAPSTETVEPREPQASDFDLFSRAQAYLCAPASAPQSAPTAEPETGVSQARRQANRANAQLSTGPVTPEGKRKSSANALKNALTGKTVLLPTDDADEYQRQLDLRLRAFQPATEEEHELVQSMVDGAWRLNRIKEIETGILLKGQLEFADKYADQPAARRLQLINSETFLKYEKSIRNLNMQEARLLRRLEKDQAHLLALQAARKRAEKLRAEAARDRVGFEFSSTSQPPAMTKIYAKSTRSQSPTHPSASLLSDLRPNSLA